MNKIVIYSAAFAGSLGVATVAVDGYAKALDPTHKDGQTFVLQLAVKLGLRRSSNVLNRTGFAGGSNS